jgi:hypothetical protein
MAAIHKRNSPLGPALWTGFLFHGDGTMQQRRRYIQIASLEDFLALEAIRLREEAKLLPPGSFRETILRKAQQAETGSHVSQWLSSPGLQAPK